MTPSTPHQMLRRPLSRVLAAALFGSVLLTLGPSAQPASAADPVYEAEQATISQGAVESNHAGFSGTGFVNYDNVTGSYVEWTVTAAAAGSTALTFRFANGTTANRPMAIQVNGTAAGTGTFAPTGSWTTWRTESVTATLNAGANTVRATATTANGGPNVDWLTLGGAPPPGRDWSKLLVDSTISRNPSSPGGWGYPQALFLHGAYLVYKRTGDQRYLTYIKRWADANVDSSGHFDRSFNNLDSMLGGNVLIDLYQETHDTRYRTAATQIRNRLNTYPRNPDGGFWHATSRQYQNWLDGVYMVLPFLVRYGQTFGDATYANNEAAKQLNIYFGHLQEPNGLLKHAYDDRRQQSWADKTTGKSPEFWCRAIGWFAMAHIEVLEVLPANHPQRATLIQHVQHMARGFERYQDPNTGRWFQVVDKGSNPDNWTETSCSSMYTYMLSRAVERGYIDSHYKAVAVKGYQGVLGRISLSSEGLTNLTDISEGTNVGNLSYYLNRARRTNDFHGLGAFLIMNEQLTKPGST